jgi:hypothetical protein
MAALNTAEANADSLSLIKLDPSAYELTDQLIQVAQGKTLEIIGHGQDATTNQSGGQGITANPFAYAEVNHHYCSAAIQSHPP